MPAGRPEKSIDWDKVDELIIQQNKADEIASHFDMAVSTFYRHVHEKFDMNFENYARTKYSKGKSNLRSKQYEKAIEGNVQLLLKLGEIYLDQKEQLNVDTNITIKHEYATSDGTP